MAKKKLSASELKMKKMATLAMATFATKEEETVATVVECQAAADEITFVVPVS